MFKIFVYLKLLLIFDVVLCKPEYNYNYEAGGWVKLHVIPATWKDAFRKCIYEGAVLASPLNKPLANALHAVVNNSGVDKIHLGTHSLYADNNFVSVEGAFLRDMYIKWGDRGWAGDGKCLSMINNRHNTHVYTSHCTDRLPYICYKKRENDKEVNVCGTFDNQYEYSSKTGSCYKFHKQIRTWSQAYEICAAEGGYLVIINNDEEASVIKGMFPRRTNPSEWDRMQIGLRDLFEDQMWLTIHGDRMEDVYHNWAPDQPDNDHGNQFCGNLYRNGGLDDNNCELKYTFVCEKDPRNKRFEDLAFRFGSVLGEQNVH